MVEQSGLLARPSVRRLLISQVWAFALCSPTLIVFTVPDNRYLLVWSLEVVSLWFVGVTGLGLGIALLDQLLCRWLPVWSGRFAVLAGLGIGLLLGQVLWEELVTERSLQFIYGLLCLLVFGCLAEISWRRGWTFAHYQRWLAQATLFFSPLLPIFWINALCWPRYSPRPTVTPDSIRAIPSRDGEPPDNVYIFVFDEWPFRLTLDDGHVLPHMPNLRQAAERMCVFTEAHAPGCATCVSMPRFIYQRTDRYVMRGNVAGFWNGDFHPTMELPSLFTTARQRGYRTAMFGWYHPYHVMLGRSADVIRSTNRYDYFGEGVGERALSYSCMTIINLLGDSLAEQTMGGSPILHNRSVVWQNETLLACAHGLLTDPRRTGQFAIIHLPLPHHPFCYCAEGVRPLNSYYDPWSEELLLDQLAYFDRVLGELFTGLQESGKLDRSLLVLTSDHNWRNDPLHAAPDLQTLSHVPLFIRFPGQQENVLVREPFSTNYLGRLLDAWPPSFRPADIATVIREGQLYRPLDPTEAEFIFLEKR